MNQSLLFGCRELPSTLSLKLFGAVEIAYNGRAVEVTSRKLVALLAYLATEPKPHRREGLATMLWPDTSHTRALANLRRVLWTANQTPVGGWLDTSAQAIALHSKGLTVDVLCCEELLHKGQGDVDALIAAVGFYRGEFLADLYLPDSSEFEEWAHGRRSRFRRRVLDALHTVADHYLKEGNYAEAAGAARRQIDIDNLHEPAYRQLFVILARSGQRTTALFEYERLRQLLREELNAEPSELSQQLATSIRSGRFDPFVQTGNGVYPLPQQPDSSSMLGSATPATSPPAEKPTCPYPGLSAFQTKDNTFFFGREDFTEQLKQAVQLRALVAVIGASGAGKTSVINAGLVPWLQRQPGWLISYFRPGTDPFQALASGLVSLLTPKKGETQRLVETRQLAEALQSGRVKLLDVVKRILEKKNGRATRLLLVGTQFEELFVLLPDGVIRHRFLDILLETFSHQQIRQPPLCTLLLTLRADFMGQALAYRPLADALRNSDIKLGPMTRAELTRAVVNPAHLQQVSFEPGLVARIMQDVGDVPGNLPLLQFALASLWEHQENRKLTHQAYDAIGEVEGALAVHAEAVLGTLTVEQQAQARRILVQLVQPGDGTQDVRRLATRTELGEEAWLLVQYLADSRLLVTGRNAAGHETAELIHEALIHGWNRLQEWMVDDRAFRLWQERLRTSLRYWEKHDRETGDLLRGSALSTALTWMHERPLDISPAEEHYIRKSATLREQRMDQQHLQVEALRQTERLLGVSQLQTKQMRRLVVLLAIALFVTLAGLVTLIVQNLSAL